MWAAKVSFKDLQKKKNHSTGTNIRKSIKYLKKWNKYKLFWKYLNDIWAANVLESNFALSADSWCGGGGIGDYLQYLRYAWGS